jgi:endonuclease YncB( thermonuclease family)
VSIRPPRRIFRSASRRGGRLPATLWPWLLGGGVGAMIVLLALPAELLGRVPPGTGTVRADAAQVAVVDGETLVVGRMVVRLDGVVAPRRGKDCHAGNAAEGKAVDCGGAAADALAGLVRGRDVECRLNGRDREGFPQGICLAGRSELNRALVAEGWARALGTRLAAEEAAARSARRGLWREGAF